MPDTSTTPATASPTLVPESSAFGDPPPGWTLAAWHIEAVADSGDAYTVVHRRPWHLSCLWCEFQTSGHRTKGDAVEAMSAHYAEVTGVPGWRVTG